MGDGKGSIASVILAAGSSPGGHYGWPKDSKPKCLFHVKGEVLLLRQVRILRELGVTEIRVVVGYKREIIEALNLERGLGLHLAYNPEWESGPFTASLKVGLRGLDDDLLISFGDVYLTREGLRKFIEDPHEIAVALGRGGGSFGYQLYKVASKYLPGLRRVEGSKVIWPLHRYCMNHGGVIITVEGIYDVDFYRYTDEGGG